MNIELFELLFFFLSENDRPVHCSPSLVYKAYIPVLIHSNRKRRAGNGSWVK